jgi:hypothetical protein
MVTFLFNVAACFGAIKILAELIAAYLDDKSLIRLKQLIERWNHALSSTSVNTMVQVPYLALARAYDKILGLSPFSWQSLRKTYLLASLLVAASLGFVGIFSGKPFAMEPPWNSYAKSIAYLSLLPKSFASQHKVGDPLFMIQNSSDLAKLSGPLFASIFTVYFVIIIVSASAFLVCLSISFSRVFLREMIEAKTPFGVLVLFTSNTFLLLAIGSFTSLTLFILANVWTWPFVPLLSSLSKASILAEIGAATAASLGSWFYSGPWLKTIVTISLFPLLLVVLLTGITLLGFAFQPYLSKAITTLLRKSLTSSKGVISFFGATAAAVALFLSCCATVWLILVNVSRPLNIPPILGLNYLAFSFCVLVSMLFLCWVKAKFDSRHHDIAITFSEVLLFFIISVFLTAFGYSAQAIISCLLPNLFNGGTGLESNILVPATESLIPGAIIGYLVIFLNVRHLGWLKPTIGIFIVLSASDFLLTFSGAASFRDLLGSVACNMLGSPISAIILLISSRLIFKKSIFRRN